MIVRTGYSFKTAVGHLETVVARAKEIGCTALAMADRASTYGYVRFTKICEKAGLRPVYGVELGVTPTLGQKKQAMDYWTFIAPSNLKDLHELIWLATAQTFNGIPQLNYDQAMAFPGIKITGPAVLLDEVFKAMKRVDPNFHVGLSPASPRGLIRDALKRGLELCAHPNNFFPREDDLELYRVMLGSRAAGTQTYPMWITSDDEFSRALGWLEPSEVGSAIKTRETVLATCLARLGKAEILHPEKPFTLLEMCQQGAAKLGVDLSDPVYEARLQKELRLIAEKEFEDYFYIIADMMAFARENMVVGPARGSSCGSLVCYLLGITSIDPIPYDLVFERFIDTTRSDLPDIDLDFSMTQRHLVFEYLDKKYGKSHSARLGSVNNVKSAAAFNIAGTALRISKERINEVTNTLIKRSQGDSRASSTIMDTFTDTDVGKKFIEEYPEAAITGKMENHPANPGQHAAGVVLTQGDVIDYVAIDARNGSTMCDKKDAEVLNLLKIDALGLKQLSVFERCLELVGKPARNTELEPIPLDDPKAFATLNDRKFSGIFQFDYGTAASKLVSELVAMGGALDNIEDIVSLTALVRPGPVTTGAANAWNRRRVGREAITYPHESMEPFLKSTLGIVVYQEQVMLIAREIGGLTWDEVTALRKAMSKSLGKEFFDQYGDKWKQGAEDRVKMPRPIADKLWDDLCAYGSWAFNRSHSVAYGIVSYWCCWLKAYHPLEYAAATLDFQDDADMQIAVLRELKKEGIDYVPVDIQRSADRWVPAGDKLVGPLTNVHGIGEKVARQIVNLRKEGKPIPPGTAKKLEAAKTPIDSLTPIEDAVKPKLVANNIVSPPTPIATITPEEHGNRSICIVGKIEKISPRDANDPISVAKRGYALRGPSMQVNLFLKDDEGSIFCKVGRFDFDRIGRAMIERARVGKSLYAIKGTVPHDFRMINIEDVRYLGEIDE